MLAGREMATDKTAAATASSSSAKPTLASLGRSVYVSQRGIEHILTELKKNNLLTAELPSSRSSVKRAREADLLAKAGRYGKLIQELSVPLPDKPGRCMKVPFISPPALLECCVQQQEFGSFLTQKIMETGCSLQAPWKLILYSDEITPGNALKIKNMRRLQAIYYTFQNLGPRSMACEALWFPLIVLRSSLCTALGGLTVLWKYALKAFFGDHDLTAGWFLQTPDVGLMLYGRLGIFVADEAALKHTVESKGAAGVVFCMRCSNVVSHNSSAADHNPDALPSTCTDATKFRLHTNQTTRALLEYLAAEQPDSSKARFKSLQTALGYNLVAEGLLMDDLGYNVPEAIMYDWFHIYLVHGIVGRDLGLLLGALRTAGIQEDDITDFLQSFRWPTQFAGADCKGILKNSSRETIHSPLKAGASELVNFLPVMRLFIILFVWGKVDDHAMQACSCFFMLVEVIDLLQKIGRGVAVPSQALHKAIVQHSQSILGTYGTACWSPKNHMALHLGEFMQRHECLISCWTHERKHKLAKRFASGIADTSKGFEESVLKDILAVQLKALETEMPGCRVRFLQKRKAPKHLTQLLHETFECDFPCFTSCTAVHGGGFSCSPGDVVVCCPQGTELIAKVEFHAGVEVVPGREPEVLTCISPWTHVAEHMYQTSGDRVLVSTACISGCCIYSERGENAIVSRP